MSGWGWGPFASLVATSDGRCGLALATRAGVTATTYGPGGVLLLLDLLLSAIDEGSTAVVYDAPTSLRRLGEHLKPHGWTLPDDTLGPIIDPLVIARAKMPEWAGPHTVESAAAMVGVQKPSNDPASLATAACRIAWRLGMADWRVALIPWDRSGGEWDRHGIKAVIDDSSRVEVVDLATVPTVVLHRLQRRWHGYYADVHGGSPQWPTRFELKAVDGG